MPYKNKDDLIKNRKKYYLENKEKVSQRNKEWNKNNQLKLFLYRIWNEERLRLNNKKYHQDNKEHVNKRKRDYRKNNIQANLRSILRVRLYSVVRGRQKIGSAVKDLGCTIDELKIHIESQFKPGMTWKNYNHKTWHIDHIKPLSKFDLTNREQFLEACNYKNLQPLWAKENFIKHNK